MAKEDLEINDLTEILIHSEKIEQTITQYNIKNNKNQITALNNLPCIDANRKIAHNQIHLSVYKKHNNNKSNVYIMRLPHKTNPHQKKSGKKR